MNLLSTLFPGWALRRARAQHLVRAYEAAKGNRVHRLRRDSSDPDRLTERSAEALRLQARYLDENHDLAIGILDVLVNNVVGSGVPIEPQIETRGGELHDDINKRIEELLENWMWRPEVTGELDWTAVQRLIARTWFRDGEGLVQMLRGNVPFLTHSGLVPFSLELLESDLLPLDLEDDRKNITQGVEKNVWGRPRAYHIYKQHPGSDRFIDLETKRVPADRILHPKLVSRFRQTRGITVFHGILFRLDDIKDYEESERVAARVAAALTGFIKKTNDYGPSPTVEVPQERQLTFSPGAIFDNLMPGEEVTVVGSNRPNESLLDYRNGQLRAAASGTMTGYSSISKDYDGTYSAQRQELVGQWPAYVALNRAFVSMVVRPVYQNIITMAQTAGLLRIPRDVNPLTIMNAEYGLPVLPWIDVKDEVEADEKKVQAGLKSRHQIIRERGGNPREVDNQIKREREQAKKKGIKFSTDGPKESAAPGGGNGSAPPAGNAPKPAAANQAAPGRDLADNTEERHAINE